MQTYKHLYSVVLIGRTNVGKSTLFNRLTDHAHALVSDIAGTTRDIKRATVQWSDCSFELIDTGGLSSEHMLKKQTKKTISDDPDARLNNQIIKKAKAAMASADIVLFVADAQTGLMPEDRTLVKWLMDQKLTLIIVANKADNLHLRLDTSSFMALGLGEPAVVSAISGSGTGDLLDLLCEKLPHNDAAIVNTQEDKINEEIVSTIKVAIIGRPNVGKSSLLNALLEEERAIVDSVPHTTREPIDTTIQYNDANITLIDTAGIRRKARIPFKSLEKQSVKLSLDTLKRADIALLVVDGSDDVGKQDLKLALETGQTRVGLVIIINKIDLWEKDDSVDHLKLKAAIQRTFNAVKWAPVELVSAQRRKNTQRIFDTIISVYKNYTREIPENDLVELLKGLSARKPPPKKRGAKTPPRVVWMEQISTAPPHFEIRYKGKGMLPGTYLGYIERGLREKYDFTGTPIVIHQKKV